jgi:uncharacterized protein YbaR (Trm112 family)
MQEEKHMELLAAPDCSDILLSDITSQECGGLGE